MTRRTHNDTAEAAIQNFKDAAGRFTWPSEEVTPLADETKQARAQKIADRIFTARAPRDWRPFDKVLIAQLAITTAELDGLQTMISRTGYVVGAEGRNGKMQFTRSPLLDPLQALQNREITLARALSITGAQGADTRTVAASATRLNDLRPPIMSDGQYVVPEPGRLWKDRPQ